MSNREDPFEITIRFRSFSLMCWPDLDRVALIWPLRAAVSFSVDELIEVLEEVKRRQKQARREGQT